MHHNTDCGHAAGRCPHGSIWDPPYYPELEAAHRRVEAELAIGNGLAIMARSEIGKVTALAAEAEHRREDQRAAFAVRLMTGGLSYLTG